MTTRTTPHTTYFNVFLPRVKNRRDKYENNPVTEKAANSREPKDIFLVSSDLQ